MFYTMQSTLENLDFLMYRLVGIYFPSPHCVDTGWKYGPSPYQIPMEWLGAKSVLIWKLNYGKICATIPMGQEWLQDKCM